MFARSYSLALPRWLVLGLLLLSLLVHLIVIKWAKDELALPLFPIPDDALATIEVQFQTPPPATKPLPSALVRKPVPTVDVNPDDIAEAPNLPSEPVADHVVAPSATMTEATTTEASDTAIAPVSDVPNTEPPPANPAPVAETKPDIPTTPEVEANPATAPDTPPLFVRFSLPPSAELSYNVTAVKSGLKIEGNGTINWQSDGTRYAVTGEAKAWLMTALSYKSTGTIEETGIAPELYVEKRLNKAPTNTHFHRDRKIISFSASTDTYPRQGGEQDRGSVIWQIAALGRGNSDVFTPGLEFELFIAGPRSGASWRVYVNGKEIVDGIQGGSTEAWHLSLMPAEKSYEMQFELWFAPERDWYPVKLHYADKNDGYLQMVLTKISSK